MDDASSREARGGDDGPEAAQTALPDAPPERLQLLIERVLETMDLPGRVEIEEDDEELRAEIVGDDLGALIGRHGQTIDALQHLLARAAFPPGSSRKRVVVDAAGYRERRELTLKRTADRAASDALQFGRPVELEPMNALERRVVHTHLAERSDVQTHSEGDEPERRLVVTPVSGAPAA